MEIWRVIGFRKVDFKDAASGKAVSGYSLFVSRPGDDHMQGDECQKIFFSDQKVSYTPCLGDEIQLVFNRFGKIADVVLR